MSSSYHDMRCRHLLLLFIVLLICPSPGWGNESRIVPSVLIKEEYNDNIFFVPDDARKDFITTISPGLELVNRTETLDTNLFIRLDRIDYNDNRAFNATDQTYKGKVRYIATPRFGISSEAGYVRDSRPDRDIGTTGISLSTAPRNRYTAAVSADYQFSEKISGVASYDYSKDRYESIKYDDSLSNNYNAGLLYDLSKNLQGLKGKVNLGYSSYVFPDSQSDTVTSLMGFTRDFSETLSIMIEGGLRHTWSKFPVNQVQQRKGDWGWVGKVALNYKGEYGSGSLTYNRDIAPASGLNGVAERNTLMLTTQYRMTYEFSLLCTAGYYTNKSNPSEFSPQVINERTLRINPGFRYEYSKDISFEGYYDYSAVSNLVANTVAYRDLIFLRLNIQYPIWE